MNSQIVRLVRTVWIFLMAAALLTGCWSRREINDLAVAMGLGIDKEGDHYVITVQVVNPNKAAKMSSISFGGAVVVYSAKSKSIFQAFRLLTKEIPRKVYFSHLQMLIISEQVAKKGIRDILDLVIRNYEFRPNFYFALAKNATAKQILSIPTAIDSIPTNEQRKSLEESERVWASTVKISYDELIQDLSSEGRNPVLTGMSIVGQHITDSTMVNNIDLKGRVRYSEMAAFNKDKFVGWLSTDASKTFSYLRNKVRNTVGVVECPGGGKAAIEITKKPKVKVESIIVRNKVRMKVTMKLDTNITEAACEFSFSNKSIEKLTKLAEQNLIVILERGLYEIQKIHQTDVLGFGEKVHVQHPIFWSKHKKSWPTEFVSVPVEFNVEIAIHAFGAINRKIKIH